ncbi:MAG TPA: DUF4180 domain-containing protein [Pseudonocardiaceae bacterium]|nr:DUF4180 domain-containing protein [Pseudonocardiaceae bacterium]
MAITTLHGIRVLVCDADGPALATERDAADLVGEAFSEQAELVVVPVARLDDRFFSLRTGVAGAIVQKLVQYRRRLAVVGDISAQLTASNALRDFVVEANRGRDVWFVPDIAALERRLRS